jgi:WD40 repeat protein
MLQFSGHGKELNLDDNAGGGGAGGRPVTKTFYDHTQSINDLAFHPFLNILASASRDNSIKLFDYGGSQKKAHQVLQDTHNVRSIVFHPSGDCTSPYYFISVTPQLQMQHMALGTHFLVPLRVCETLSHLENTDDI